MERDDRIDLRSPDPRARDELDPTESVRILGAEEAAEARTRGAESRSRWSDRPEPPAGGDRPALRFPLATAEADPPRPRVAPGPRAERDDDLEVWSDLGSSEPRWRDDPEAEPAPPPTTVVAASGQGRRLAEADVADADPDDGGRRSDDGGVDARPDDQGFDDDDATSSTSTSAGATRAGPGLPPDRDVRIAVLSGVAIAAAALALFAIGPGAAMVLVAGVVVVAAAELYSGLLRAGYQPATLLGLVATGSLALAAYWRGETAVPVVLGLAVIATLLWYLVGVSRVQPTMNVAVSLLVVLYVGLLGSFASLILGFPDGHGTGVLIATVLAVVANDVGALVVGRRFGRHRIAPEISPNKTREGLLGGAVATILVSVVLVGFIGWAPFGGVGDALALGVVVAIAAPLGDLCESMLKRDLGLKDMGAVLPGHGGLLDRFDALLFALPAVYYLCRVLEIT